MTNRKIRDYQRNRKLKGIVDANFKTFATVAIALKHLFPHDWYNKTITDFTSSYAEFTKHMNDYDAEAYDFRVEDFCRKLNISDSDTYDIIFRLNGKLPAEIFLALQNNLKCMLIHLRLNCSIGSQRYAKLIAYLKSDAKICGQADLIALGLSFDDEIDYRKLNFIQEMILIKQKYIKSPLNYVGGKYKLLPQILPLFPKNIDTFIDLFGGGFNVGINVPAKEVVYNDLNLPVVQILEYIHRNRTDKSLDEIDEIIKQYDLSKINRNGYLRLRSYFNESESKQSVILYVLICYAFNNQMRFNSKGEFNMPFGERYFNPTLRERFIEFSEAISNKGCKFTNADFREFIGVAFGENDFLYCDPPYFNSTATYNENGGWTNADEKDLRDMLATSNVKWALSNNLKTNLTLKDWAEGHGYKTHYLNTTYGNCNYQKKDKTKDIEVLITNY